MGELVLAYDVKSNNQKSKPRAFYALYTGPNDRGTGHSVSKLSTKAMILTPRCKPIPMPDDVISIVNQMGVDDGPPEGIVFCNIHKELSVEDLYRNVDSQDNNDNASDTSWDKKKDDGQNDNKNIVYDDDVEHDKIDDLNEDLLHLRNRLGDNINDANNGHQYIEEEGILNEDEGQGNDVGNTNNIPLANNIPLGQNKHFGGAYNIDNDNDENNDKENENQNHGRNNGNQISDDDTTGNASYDDDDDDDDRYDGIPEGNHQHDHDPPEGGDHNPEDEEHEEHEDDNVDEPGDDGQDANDIDQLEDETGSVRRRNRRSMHQSLPSGNNGDELNGPYWDQVNSHIYPILGAMVVAKQAGARMMKEYFEIEASKSTPQFGFRK